MKTHREMPWLWRSLVLAACTLPTSSCVDAIVGEVDVCEYGGKSYTLHEKFPALDGCNTCTCEIDGSASCTEQECETDDAGVSASLYCKGSDGKIYESGDTFPDSDGCNTCSCLKDGSVSCTDKACEPRPSGTCKAEGKLFEVGERYKTSDGCRECTCYAQDSVMCAVLNPKCIAEPISDAGVLEGGVSSCEPFSCPSGKGSCSYAGKAYAVGSGFEKGDNCNKCLCVADGQVECSAASCQGPAGCQLGSKLLSYGTSVVCEDGCNTCTCNPGGFSSTLIGCPALPLMGQCQPNAAQISFPATLVYTAGDSLAVAEARCVNGQAADFALCFDGLSNAQADIYVVPTGATRACAGTERVYSLKGLRDVYVASSMQMGGKIVLRGIGESLLYQFGI